MRQNNQVELNLSTGAEGEAPRAAAQETEARAAKVCLERPAVAEPSMEAVAERENLKKALAQVKRNKGAPGIDGMTVENLGTYLKEHGSRSDPSYSKVPTSRSRCGASRYRRLQAA
jgi:RNA-directed DNA polymerase